MALFVLVLLGLVLAVSLPFVGLIGNEWRHVVKAFIVLAICLIAIISFSYTYYFYSTEQLVEGYTDNLASAFGVSPLLAKAATFALLLPAGMALTWAFWSTDKTKRRRGQAILAGAAVFYFLALWVATKDQKVSRPGEALQCYVVTEQSVVWRDIRYRGTDPETGRPCEPAKPDILPTLARLDALLRSGRPLEPIDPKGHLFGSDRPPLWFSRTKDGGLEFYDVPAPDPRTRRPMQAVTEAVIAEWKRHEAEKAEAEQQKHLDHMRGLVLTGGSADLGLDIVQGRADNALDRLAAKRLPDLLSRTVPDTMHVASAPAHSADSLSHR